MKNIWTELDFEEMGWHDSHIYSIQYDADSFRLSLDIDYICEWIKSEDEKSFQFYVVPATLIFENVWDLKIEIEPISFLEINEIVKENPRSPKNAEFVNNKLEWDWNIDVFTGTIGFKAIGFVQKFRKKPILQKSQTLPITERKELYEYLASLRLSEDNTLIL
jgi:hypothetical protein